MNVSRTVEEGDYERIIAIGDLHGYREPLFRLFDEVVPSRNDLLIFIGDYVDRGPESREVLQSLIDFSSIHSGCMFLKGNHEDMMLGALGFDACINDINTWLYNGGGTTLRSYGVSLEELSASGGVQAAPGLETSVQLALRDVLPASHLEFLSGLPSYIESEHFLFCHAGVAPHVSIAVGKLNDFDLLWMRDHIHAEAPAWEKTVVCGHTPLREVMLKERLICVDTGLFYYGMLSAVDVLSRKAYSVGR